MFYVITIKDLDGFIKMKNATKTTFDTDAGSELFKRTPLDLMKQHASLLTNILCLAITLSLVLVTGGYSILMFLFKDSLRFKKIVVRLKLTLIQWFNSLEMRSDGVSSI